MIAFLLALSLLLTNHYAPLNIESQKDSQFKYFTAGSEIGLGFRNHKRYGYDISCNYSLILTKNYSLKGYYLNYPIFHTDILIYWGMGAGASFSADPSYREPHDYHRSSITADVLLGYEFCPVKNTIIFIQCEIGLPIAPLNSSLLPVFKIGTRF